jgi:hypothetical protein
MPLLVCVADRDRETPANFAARVAIFRLPDGRIAEVWSLEDSLSRLLQLASSTARLRRGGSSPATGPDPADPGGPFPAFVEARFRR